MTRSSSVAKVATAEDVSADSDRWDYVFEPYRLDPVREMLTCGGKAIALPARLFALLYALIAADGKIVSRERLSLLIWPGGNVADGNLSQHIYMLRHALGESGGGRQFIMTVHGKGFRFAAPLTLAPAARPLSKPAATNPAAPDSGDENPFQAGYEAFAMYSRASALLERPAAAALGSALECLDAALAIDGGFVPALVEKARAYTLLAQNCYAAAEWAFPRALDAIDRAFVRAPSAASVHAVRATLTLLARWDWSAAKHALDTAMSLNAVSPLVRVSAAWLYEYAGNYARAMTELQHALRLLPHSSGLKVLLGRLLVNAREYDRAIEYLSHLLDGDQQFALARQYRAEAFVLAGRPDDAIADLVLVPQDPREDAASRLPLLCRAYAQAGDMQRASAAYDRLLEASYAGFVARGSLAMCLVSLGRYDEALAQLERALAAREPCVLLLPASPWFTPVASSKRFERALRSIAPRPAQL